MLVLILDVLSHARCIWMILFFFFFNDTATTEIYPLSLHAALPIWRAPPRARTATWRRATACRRRTRRRSRFRRPPARDRKSTRLNSSHANISYAVFCLKKKKHIYLPTTPLKISLAVYYIIPSLLPY